MRGFLKESTIISDFTICTASFAQTIIKETVFEDMIEQSLNIIAFVAI
jgi:hypothetical protein